MFVVASQQGMPIKCFTSKTRALDFASGRQLVVDEVPFDPTPEPSTVKPAVSADVRTSFLINVPLAAVVGIERDVLLTLKAAFSGGMREVSAHVAAYLDDEGRIVPVPK